MSGDFIDGPDGSASDSSSSAEDSVPTEDVFAPPALEPGEPVADAEVVELLAQGGGVAVFRAQREDGSEVSVVAAGTELDEASRDRFMTSASELSQVVDEAWAADLAIPTAVDPVVTAFVVDLAPSGTMGDLSVLRWSSDQKVDFLRKLCVKVGKLHDEGRAHGCLLPEVVLLDADLTPAVINTGGIDTAALFQDGDERLREAYRPYTSPEVRSGEAADRYADIYALGRLIHFALTESTPHEVDEAIPRLDRLEAPPGLIRIIRKCTQTDPVARYESATELGEELGRYQRDEPVGIRHPDVTDGVQMSIPPPKKAKAETPTTPDGATLPESIARKKPRKGGWSPAIGVAAIVFGGALLGAAIALGPGAEPPMTWVWLLVAVGAPFIMTLAIPSVGPRPALARLGIGVLGAAAVVGLDPTMAFDPPQPELGRLDGRDVAARVAQFDALQKEGETFFMSVDLSGADLSNRTFGAIQLQGSNLSGADLSGSSLNAAEMMNVDLTEANLSGADISGLAPGFIKGIEKATCDDATKLPAGWTCQDTHPTPAGDG